jgi:hypothetical protein
MEQSSDMKAYYKELRNQRANNVLNKTYYDTSKGFIGRDKLQRKLRDEGVTYAQTNKFLDLQPTVQVNRERKEPQVFNTIWANAPGENYQMDFAVWRRHEWHGWKYGLFVIDVHSRKLAIRAAKTRSSLWIASFMEMVHTDFDGVYPKNLNCDNEFNTKEFVHFCHTNGIKLWFSQPYEINKNAIVERVIKTISAMLARWRWETTRNDWPNVLEDMVYNYNHTWHQTINATPDDVWNGVDINHQKRKVVEDDFQVGDRVRIKMEKKTFEKGDRLKYSPTIYLIYEIQGNKYRLQNAETKKILDYWYKAYEIKKVASIITEATPETEQEQQTNQEIKSTVPGHTELIPQEEEEDNEEKERADILAKAWDQVRDKAQAILFERDPSIKELPAEEQGKLWSRVRDSLMPVLSQELDQGNRFEEEKEKEPIIQEAAETYEDNFNEENNQPVEETKKKRKRFLSDDDEEDKENVVQDKENTIGDKENVVEDNEDERLKRKLEQIGRQRHPDWTDKEIEEMINYALPVVKAKKQQQQQQQQEQAKQPMPEVVEQKQQQEQPERIQALIKKKKQKINNINLRRSLRQRKTPTRLDL